MLTKPKTTGPSKVIRFKRRKQKRLPRRPLEAIAEDFATWDAGAADAGLNWSEFTRRALHIACGNAEQLEALLARRRLSEKGGFKNEQAKRAKAAATRAGRKG